MSEYTEEDEALFEMSDEELEAAFKEAKAGNIEVDEPEEVQDDEVEVETEDEEESEVEMDEDEEVSEDDTEQPGDEDSEDEEDAEEEDEESDEDPDEGEDDEPESEDEESEEPEAEIEKFKYKANGEEFEFTLDEIKEQFGTVFGQAANYTKKMQALADGRKTLSALKDNNVSHEDVNLMIDVLKGDKDAVAAMIKRTGVDALELDVEQESVYAPNEYGKSDQELAIDDVLDNISQDQEFAVTQHVVDKQWDAGSRKALATNPQMIQGLHSDIKTGVYDKVSPMAMKLKVLDGGSKSDVEYYIEAGAQYYQGLEKQKQVQADTDSLLEARAKEEQDKIAQVKQKKTANKVVKKAAGKRKAAAPTKKVAAKKGVVDYLDESDENFDKWYEDLMNKH